MNSYGFKLKFCNVLRKSNCFIALLSNKIKLKLVIGIDISELNETMSKSQLLKSFTHYYYGQTDL